MSWGEAHRLTLLLMSDPSSQVAAAAAEWDHPWPREVATLADLFDLTAAAHSGKKKPKPYPRPWRDAETKRVGDVSRWTQDQVRAELARMRGGDAP